MTNIEPRAKIGDVVIVKEHEYWKRSTDETFNQCGEQQFKIMDAYLVPQYGDNNELVSKFWHYEAFNYKVKEDSISFSDKDILKNLTTNISYEA